MHELSTIALLLMSLLNTHHLVVPGWYVRMLERSTPGGKRWKLYVGIEDGQLHIRTGLIDAPEPPRFKNMVPWTPPFSPHSN
jgi:hypothetical protein